MANECVPAAQEGTARTDVAGRMSDADARVPDEAARVPDEAARMPDEAARMPDEAGPALIEFNHVSYAYDDALALDDITFSIGKGQMVALTGPNGSGKSTILRIMNGLEFPHQGTYRFDGHAIDQAAMHDALFAKRFHQRLGYIFQNSDTQLFCPSVREEIAFGPRQMGLGEDQIEQRVEDMLQLLSIKRLETRAPYRLSGERSAGLHSRALLR